MRTSKRPTAPTCIRTRTTCGPPGNGRWVPRSRRMGEPGTPRQRARQRQRQHAEQRVAVLQADPSAMNAWEQNVLSVLAGLPEGEVLEADAFRQAAGYCD